MKKHLPLIVLAGLLAMWLPAQTLPPAMFDESGDQARPLDLNTVKVEVRISGMVAKTTLTLSFGNPGARAVAGNLYLPLPPLATVSGYALDVQGVMVDGVPVDRDTGRQVYQAIVRRGLDPGLVEWTKGNVFKTRVFPVPPGGSRQVRISYISPLDGDAKGQSYRLPLQFKKAIKDFQLSIEVLGPDSAPVIVGAPDGLKGFSDWRQGWRTDFQARDFTANQDIIVKLPGLDRHPLTLEKAADGSVYFAWFGPKAELDGSDKGASAPTAGIEPKALTLYWDASASRLNARNADIIKAISLALQRWTANRTVVVRLVAFRDKADIPVEFKISQGKTEALAAALAGLVYDGGSRIAGLPTPRAGDDLAILVSDGLNNLGPLEWPAKSVPLFCLSADARVNATRLVGLAAANGGGWIDVKDPVAAAAALGRAPFRLIEASVLSGNIEGIVSAAGTATGLVGVSGRLTDVAGRVSLRFGYGSQTTRTVLLDIKAALAADAPAPGTGFGPLAILWAQSRLAELLSAPDADSIAVKASIKSLGLEYSLVTPGTSLIVLETLAQYVEFRIRPPASLADMRRQWDERQTQAKKADKSAQDSHLEQVIGWWRERQEWWNTTFKYPSDYRWTESAKDKAAASPDAESDRMMERRNESSAPAGQPGLSNVANASPTVDAKKAESGKDGAAAPPAPEISIKAWTPDTPYLRELSAAAGRKEGDKSPLSAGQAGKVYGRYLAIRAEYAASPAFYMDVGDFLQRGGQSDLAVRVWSNLAEMDLENPGILRILAYRLTQAGLTAQSAIILRDVLLQRPEEPQSYRDLALVLAARAEYAEAAKLLYQVVVLPDVTGPDGRRINFDKTSGIELVALTELNALLPRARAARAKLPEIDPRLVKLLDTDIRIVLNWDTDNCDMDLWVIEPSGEKAFYGHRNTRIGGMVSNDITNGYGPEEYLIRRAMKGEYTIKVNFYGTANPEVTGAVTLQAEVITNFGRPNESRQSLTLRLAGREDTYTVGSIKF